MTHFESRPISFKGPTEVRGWSLKTYHLTASPNPIPDEITANAIAICTSGLGEPNHHGVGFVIVHQGLDAIWALVDTWDDEIIHQRTYRAPLDAPLDLELVPSGGPTMCVWELEIIDYERRSYTRHVLAPDNPDPGEYLRDGYRPERDQTTRDLVVEFNAAWAAGDLDRLMATMHPEGIYSASTGPEPGMTYAGQSSVRRGFADVIAAEAGAAGDNPTPAQDTDLQFFVSGDRAVSYWSYATITPEGAPGTVTGVDVWAVADNKLLHKDAYRKAFPDQNTTDQ